MPSSAPAGWGGRTATAFRTVPMVFGREPAVPVLEVVADVNEGAAKALAEEFGFARWTTDWRDVLEDPSGRRGRHHHAERPPSGDRHRRGGSRQARLLREAARQHGRRGEGDDRVRRKRPVSSPSSASTTSRIPARVSRRTSSTRARSVRSTCSAAPSTRTSCPTPMYRSRGGRTEDRGFRRARRHGLAHAFLFAIPGRRDRGGVRHDRHLHQGAPGRRRRLRPQRQGAPPMRRAAPVENDDVVQFLIRYTSGAMGVDRGEPHRHRAQDSGSPTRSRARKGRCSIRRSG